MKNISEADKNLIVKAKNLHCSDWHLCEELASQAESEEAKQEIRRLGKKLYHREEAAGGML